MENKVKRLLAGMLSVSMLLSVSMAVLADEAETTQEAVVENETMPPEIPEGMGGRPDGEKPMDLPEGEMPMGGKGQGEQGMGGGRIKFSDVADDAWYSEYVNFVASRGIMKGKNGEFKPTEITTRAEYVLALYNAAGAPEVSEKSTFTDVAEDSEYANAVAWAEQNGIASGTGDGTFAPDNSLTREMAMTFLYRALSALGITYEIPVESTIGGFLDSTLVSSWASDAMNTLVEMGIISGTDTGELKPQGSLVNSEVATMIYRLLGGNNMMQDRPDSMERGNGEQAPDIMDRGNKENREEPPAKPEEALSEEKAAKLEEVKAKLAEKLEAGEITQEEYDEAIAAIDAGEYKLSRGGMGKRPEKAPEVQEVTQ